MSRELLVFRAFLGGLVLAGLAGCQGSVPQFNTPRFDASVFVPPNPTQFARRDAALTPVTQADLVDAAGNCAAAAPEGATLQRNVALQMTECEVVRALGPPGSVNIGANQRGDRSVTLTYMTPDRPTYHFTGGRLSSIERGAEPPPEPARRTPRRQGSGRST